MTSDPALSASIDAMIFSAQQLANQNRLEFASWIIRARINRTTSAILDTLLEANPPKPPFRQVYTQPCQTAAGIALILSNAAFLANAAGDHDTTVAILDALKEIDQEYKYEQFAMQQAEEPIQHSTSRRGAPRRSRAE